VELQKEILCRSGEVEVAGPGGRAGWSTHTVDFVSWESLWIKNKIEYIAIFWRGFLL